MVSAKTMSALARSAKSCLACRPQLMTQHDDREVGRIFIRHDRPAFHPVILAGIGSSRQCPPVQENCGEFEGKAHYPPQKPG